jgi:hypothetical protein
MTDPPRSSRQIKDSAGLYKYIDSPEFAALKPEAEKQDRNSHQGHGPRAE